MSSTAIDGGKLIKGRKRHIVVDTMGLLLAVIVTAANVDDAKGAKEVLKQLAAQDFPRLALLWADNKYHNYDLEEWLTENARFTIEVVSRPKGSQGFVPAAEALGGGTFAGLDRAVSSQQQRL